MFERKGFAREMVSNCNVGATTYTVCWVGTALACQVVFEWKGRIALQAGHASPIKWCLKENVLVGKCSTVAMLELQSIRFAGWPKAGKKKKTHEAGLFFLVPTSL